MPVRLSGKAAGIAIAALIPLVMVTPLSAQAQTDSESALLALKAPGPYKKPQPSLKGFAVGDPIVAAGYSYTPEFIHAAEQPSASLYRHPALAPHYANPAAWHYAQLQAMNVAGLNVVMVVYNGDPVDDATPGAPRHNAIAGLPALVKAAESLRHQAGKVPRIALFYDTSSLIDNADHRTVDLSKPTGRAWFYVSIRNFFSCIPPDLRATVDGKPLVFLPPVANAETNGMGDPRVLDYVRMRFRADFGTEPYIIAHTVWQFPNADGIMDGNSRDPLYTRQAVALSPGWRQRPWEGPPNTTTDRPRGANGSHYRSLWDRLLVLDPSKRPNVVLIDSWNAWGNDSAIAPSREYGDTYIRLTRHYTDLFKARKQISPSGPYAGASFLSLLFDPEMTSRGITLITTPQDGQVRFTSESGISFVETVSPPPKLYANIYFAVDDSFRGTASGPIEVMVEYWDEGSEPLQLQYDSTDISAPASHNYKYAMPVAGSFDRGPLTDSYDAFYRTDTKTWKSVLFRLNDAALSNGQNGGADFRFITPSSTPVRVRWVTVRKLTGK